MGKREGIKRNHAEQQTERCRVWLAAATCRRHAAAHAQTPCRRLIGIGTTATTDPVPHWLPLHGYPPHRARYRTAACARRPRHPLPLPAAAAAPPPGLWINGIHFSAQIESPASSAIPSGPADGLNFGRLFNDHANQAQLNQLLLTANKPLDPKNSDYQWGFKAQVMYGSDARYTQFLGELNRVDPGQRYQLDVVEANVLAHLPWLTRGRHRPSRSASTRRRSATRRSIRRPTRSTRTPTSSTSACR